MNKNEYIFAILRELNISMPIIEQDLSGEHLTSEYYPPEDKVIYVKPDESMGAYFEIAHELRHKWQLKNCFNEYFRDYKEMDAISIEEYGEQKAEIDANAFAVVMALKYLDYFPLFDGYPSAEKKKIYERVRNIASDYGVGELPWEEIYKITGIEN